MLHTYNQMNKRNTSKEKMKSNKGFPYKSNRNVFNITIKERNSYALRSNTTGKIIAKFRLFGAAHSMKSYYEDLHYDKLEVIKL